MSGQACAMCPPHSKHFTCITSVSPHLSRAMGITESLGDHQVKESLASKLANYLPIPIQVLPPQCLVHF